MKSDKANANPILSSREKQLLRRLAQGKADEKIAVEIGGRTDQITLQRKRLIERLRIQSQEHLSALARRLASWRPSKDRIKLRTEVDIGRRRPRLLRRFPKGGSAPLAALALSKAE